MPFITLYDPEGNPVEVIVDDKASLLSVGFTEKAKSASSKPKIEKKPVEPVKSGSQNKFVN